MQRVMAVMTNQSTSPHASVSCVYLQLHRVSACAKCTERVIDGGVASQIQTPGDEGLLYSHTPHFLYRGITYNSLFVPQKIVYMDNQVSKWQKKLEPPKSPDYLKPLVDVLTADPMGDWLKPVFAAHPRFRDPVFKNLAGWSAGTKQLVNINARGTSWGPCFVSDSINGISIQPVMFNIAPRLISTSAEGIQIGPALINVAPYLIHISPKGIDSSPKMIDINPRIIQISPSVAWTGVPVRDVLGKPDRKRPSDPPPGNKTHG